MFVSFQRLFDWVLLFLFSFWSFWEILFSWRVSLFVCLSFVLMTDPSLMNLTNYKELFHLVDEYFIQGEKSDLTEKEEILKNSKFKLVFENLKYKDNFLVAIIGIRQ